MRILIITQYFWPEYFRINELANSLTSAGCTITVLTGQPNYPDGHVFKGYKAASFKEEIHNGYTIIRVPVIPRPTHRFKSIGMFINYASFVFSAGLFGPRLLRKKKFDAQFVYAVSPILQVLPAIVIKRIKKVPIVTWVGDLWPETLFSTGFVKTGMFLRIIKQIVRYIYRNCDLILVQSRSFKQSVQSLSSNVPIEYFPNPGEDSFSIIKTDGVPFALGDGFNIVFAGNLGSVQALDTVFDAALLLRNHTDIKFVLIGSGSKVDWLKDAIEREGLTNIDMPGRFDADYMPGIFKQADLLLVSLKHDETMNLTVPSKIQSYMAASKPIIASLDGEGALLVEEAGAGMASPAGDAAALAEAILILKNLTVAERDKMGLAGRKYYEENFDINVLTTQLVARLKLLTDKSPK